VEHTLTCNDIHFHVMSNSCNLPNAEDMRCIKLNDKMDMQKLTEVPQHT